MLLRRFFEGPARASALTFRTESLSGDALRHRVFAQVSRLQQHGVRPGDTLAVWATLSPETLVAVVANLALGAITVPINPSVGERELSHILHDSAPRAVLGDVPAGRVGALPVLPIARTESPSATIDPLAHGADDTALVLYTSGTTGLPKGAMLTRANLAANLDALALAWQWSDEDTLTHALPLFHVHGLVLGALGPLHVGAGLHLLDRFDPEAVARALEGGATMLFGVPTMYHRIAERAESDASLARSLARARLLVSGSAGLPEREHRRIERLSGRGVLERYGLTETLINTAVRAADGPRPGFVGLPLDGTELRLVDDARHTLDVWDDSTPGEVAVRGPSVFRGYLHRPDATAAVLDADGWFYTGDIATRAPDGALRIVGRRATDLIKTGGYKVGAGEVEAALLEHPRVREAAVLGAPDADLGERIEAWVALTDGPPVAPDELSAFVAASLSPHKRPRRVTVVPALPRNAMGKVLKTSLRTAP